MTESYHEPAPISQPDLCLDTEIFVFAEIRRIGGEARGHHEPYVSAPLYNDFLELYREGMQHHDVIRKARAVVGSIVFFSLLPYLNGHKAELASPTLPNSRMENDNHNQGVILGHLLQDGVAVYDWSKYHHAPIKGGIARVACGVASTVLGQIADRTAFNEIVKLLFHEGDGR